MSQHWEQIAEGKDNIVSFTAADNLVMQGAQSHEM